MDMKLDKELDMKISHGRAREEREECARGEEEVQAGPAPGQTGPTPAARLRTRSTELDRPTRYVEHQDHREEDTPWSSGGEEQLDVKMGREQNLTSSEAHEEKKGAGRSNPVDRPPPATRSKPGSWLVPTGAIPAPEPSPVVIRSRPGLDRTPVPCPV
ncbi:hypothetical protein QYE76_017580 [Lolium multiflorum]|uniref:Uncharacterized protein n=1 Tax=Lolium multiflorum TaxID=4521 RepID=A0AAD8QEU4_LOLMU|nr:hypothetical protein QYE76_017580 [Lolium multiflorum]